MSITIPSKISTPRLTLIRLTNTSPSHPHVQLFHENWSDPSATAWSLHGATKSLEESRDWMIEHRTKYDNIFYSAFAKPQPQGDVQSDQKIWSLRDVYLDGEEQQGENEILGIHIGSVSLRLQPSGPVLSPYPALSQHNNTSHQENLDQDLDLRVLGYALFPSAWGYGYATEANRGVLDAYATAVSAQKQDTRKKYYVEAAVDEDNLASEKVLKKLGFKKLGWKDEEEKVWLNGGWRGPGYWVYGMFV
ncbi:hypothetical protein yc1106_06455 [Curvularia clavata]|uniref:N-acetyltransferase domain-containing protein n=1 Tax=Curvularia clavata TaxID=95742 RepID=A0A9Q8Z9W2_CURCL|nr:hypothetical protein yc1106_06455 [Curvularia clavata]